jgi:hypothetical protein
MDRRSEKKSLFWFLAVNLRASTPKLAPLVPAPISDFEFIITV